MIYLPYSALFFSFIAAINWQLMGNGGGGKYSCWVFVTSETEEMLVCVTVICLVSYISCHYVTGLFCFCFCLFAYTESLGQHAGIFELLFLKVLPPRVTHWGSSCHLV